MLLSQNKPIDHWLTVRKAVVSYLTANAPIYDITAEKIWGEQPPGNIGWPFIRVSGVTTEPYVASRQSGSSHRFSIHVFDKSNSTDQISRISARVIDLMNDFSVPSLDLVDLQWISTTPLRDTDEAGAWHFVIDFSIIAVETTI